MVIQTSPTHHCRIAGGGVDPSKNTALAVVLKRLKAQDVPKDNIAKALAKVNDLTPR